MESGEEPQRRESALSRELRVVVWVALLALALTHFLVPMARSRLEESQVRWMEAVSRVASNGLALLLGLASLRTLSKPFGPKGISNWALIPIIVASLLGIGAVFPAVKGPSPAVVSWILSVTGLLVLSITSVASLVHVHTRAIGAVGLIVMIGSTFRSLSFWLLSRGSAAADLRAYEWGRAFGAFSTVFVSLALLVASYWVSRRIHFVVRVLGAAVLFGSAYLGNQYRAGARPTSVPWLVSVMESFETRAVPSNLPALALFLGLATVCLVFLWAISISRLPVAALPLFLLILSQGTLDAPMGFLLVLCGGLTLLSIAKDPKSMWSDLMKPRSVA